MYKYWFGVEFVYFLTAICEAEAVLKEVIFFLAICVTVSEHLVNI